MESTIAPIETRSKFNTLPNLFGFYCELTKIRLSILVVFTTTVGFIMASQQGIDWFRLLWTVVGTSACACAAAALNQVFERKRDAKMRRTRLRPIPAGHIGTAHAFIIGILLSYVGVAVLSFGVNIQAAGIALLTILIYVLVYTPLKSITTLNTIVGALVGGLPPLIGWVAVSGGIGTGGLVLAGILFIWQLPHFLALAWMYRDDYERGGFRMLPIIDKNGELTARMSVITSLCLVPLTLLMVIEGLSGILFGIVGSILGVWLSGKAIVFWRNRDENTARKLFYATIIYLPILFVAMIIDHQILLWIA